MSKHEKRVLGVILAGGTSRRFGADKTAALLGGRSLLSHVVERARPQVDMLLLNANDAAIGRDIAQVERLRDAAPGEGPVAGILAALSEAEKRGYPSVASFACDTPFFPGDTVARLKGAKDSSGADYAVACRGDKVHRIFALWSVAVRVRLKFAFARGLRKLRDVEDCLAVAFAAIPAEGGPDGDPFFNINTKEELEAAERWLAGGGH